MLLALVVIAPPHHRLVGQWPIPIEELRDEGFIIREPGSGTRASMERFFDQHGFTVQAVMELSDNSAIKQAVAAGIGLAVISESAVELELEAQRMCILAVEGFPLVRHWYTVYLARKRLSPPAQAFLSLLHAQVQSGQEPP